MMSKQLATIATDVPLELDLPALELGLPDVNALAALYRELGFNSLLRELGAEAVASSAPANSESAAKADYAQIASVAEFREYLAKLPAKQPVAIWLNLEAGEREAERFGTRLASNEGFSETGRGRFRLVGGKSEALETPPPPPPRAKNT